MTTYQSQTVSTVDREGNSLAFSTVNLDGEEAVLKAAVDIDQPDGQRLTMNVLYTGDDVRELIAFLHDNFGWGVHGKSTQTQTDEANQKYFFDGWASAFQEMLVQISAGSTALDLQQWATTQVQRHSASGNDWPTTPADLQYYADQDAVWQPKPGDTVHVVTATVTDHQTGTVVPIEPEGRQCPVIYSGVQCAGPEGHAGDHGFVRHDNPGPFPQTAVLSQNDAGAVPPPADAQGVATTPQSGVRAPDQPAAESATGASTPDTAPASTSEKPKRKRRTKLEIAFDEALKAYSEDGSSEHAAALNQAHSALKAKDPGNSRLSQIVAAEQTGIPYPPVEATDQSGPAFAPEPLADGAQPVFGQVYAPDQHGGIPAQAFGTVPAFQPGQAPELGQTQVSPEEQQAANGFPCPIQSSDGRPCLRPYGHELQTATNPQPKPHVYATTAPSQLGQSAQATPEQQFNSQPWTPGPDSGFPAAAPLSFQVPPTPQATAPHPETNLQPPAPAAPSWAEPV